MNGVIAPGFSLEFEEKAGVVAILWSNLSFSNAELFKVLTLYLRINEGGLEVLKTFYWRFCRGSLQVEMFIDIGDETSNCGEDQGT
jgi:hypothetical protein